MDPTAFWGTGQPQQPSATTAAPAGEQPGAPGQPTPGAAPVPAAGVGTSPTGQATPPEPPQESEADRALREAQARASAAQAEAQRLRGTLGQVEQWAQTQAHQQQRQAVEQQYQRDRESIFAAAQNMSQDDAFAYIQRQVDALDRQRLQQIDAIQQQAQQREQQIARQFATPLWAQELAKQHHLPPDAVNELLDYGDPDAMQRQAPRLAARYQQFQQLQQQIDQLARSQQAGRLVAQGAGMAGGQQAANLPLPESDDPDVRAMQIYAQLKTGTYAG